MSPIGDSNGLPGLDRRLATPTDERWGSRLTRRRLAPAIAVAAIGSVLVAAPVAAQVVDSTEPTTSTTDTTAPGSSTTDTTAAPDGTTTTTADPFDAGVPVTDVTGDSTTTVPKPSRMKFEAGKVKDVRGDGNRIQATGSQKLSGGGVDFFVNTNITFSTSSSASAAMSEASYTTATTATTLNGGTVTTTLNDAFDGYNTLCVDVNDNGGPCETGNASFVIYNKLGPAAVDPTCASGSAVDFPDQTIDSEGLVVSRQVFVPSGSSWGRWLDSFTNTGASPVTFRAATGNNLGSDSNTIVTGNGGTNWYGTMQNYSGTTSSDPRLGHVLGQAGAPLAVSDANFADGDDNPYWGYSITLQPGETTSILNYVVVSPAKATANATAASLSGGAVSGQFSCLSDTQRSEVKNFLLAVPPTTTTTSTTPPTTEAPTTVVAAAAVESTSGTLPYTGAGEELLPLAGAGAAVAGAGAVVATATRRRIRRPGWRHRR